MPWIEYIKSMEILVVIRIFALCMWSCLFIIFNGPEAYCQNYNVAAGKRTEQKTDVDWHGFLWTADKAVDNCLKRDDPDTQTCCSSSYASNENENFWRIDLGGVYEIETIKVFARNDPREGRSQYDPLLDQLHGFNLCIKETQTESELCVRANITNQTDGIYETEMHHRLAGVTIKRPKDFNNQIIITICEFQAFAVCEKGTFGPNCTEKCGNCLNSNCNRTTGACSEGCKFGWYGGQCLKPCGNCSDNKTCNSTTGHCDTGCNPGWTGSLCNTTCADGKWGSNCNRSCFKCINRTVCDIVDGRCSRGCEAGWTDIKCDKKCSSGWGPECESQCGHCSDGEKCHHINGSCYGQCAPGWLGERCIYECNIGSWGTQCNHSCGNCLENKTCNHENGECLNGCGDGWAGPLCMEAVQRVNTKLIGGVVGGVIAIISIVMGALMFWRRRHGSRRGRNENSCENYINPVINSESVSDDNPVSHNKSLYTNATKKKSTTVISVEDLREFCKANFIEDSPLLNEFDTIPYGLQYETKEAISGPNRNKNRYRDMFAYDKNRICLPTTDENIESDYINASYIKGYTDEIVYIASQGVMENTLNDFWWMIWTQKISTIVVLTRCYEAGKLKSYQYWPERGEKNYGNVSVSVNREEKFADFTVRHLLCKYKTTSTPRLVTQFHYTAWPDKDVPDHPLSLVQFWRKLKNRTADDKMPWLVHCSAGVGRTGTFIAIDYLYQQAMAEGVVNVFDCVMKLREQRVNMVQTPTQYIFLHQATLEAVQPIGNICTPEHYSELLQELRLPASSTSTTLETEFNLIERDTEDNMVRVQVLPTAANDVYNNVTVENYADSKLPENISKSRDPNVLPDDRYRPWLLETAGCQSNYINAVWLQIFMRGNRLIITQTPLPHTTVDFLRLVWDNHVEVVVMMEADVYMHNTGIYWETKMVGPFAVDVKQDYTLNNYIWREIYISLLGEMRMFKQIQYTGWSEANLPKNISSFLNFFDDAIRSVDSSAPLVVHCLNGANRSGLFCVLFDIFERLKAEKEIAIADTVRSMKIRRPQIIPNENQYKFCYDVIDEHLKSVEMYANVL